MRMVCCYCRKEYGNVLKLPPNLPKGTVSHGICKDCAPRANAEVDRLIKLNREKKV